MKRKKRKKIHAVDAIASSECVISGKAKEMKDVRRLKSKAREVKVTVDECVSGANANARRSTSANAKRKFEKEESSTDDDAICFDGQKLPISEVVRKCSLRESAVLRKTTVSKI